MGALACVVALAFFFVGFFVRDLVGQGSGSVETSPTPTPTPSAVYEEPSRGPENAPVTIIEYIDYQCPFCKRYAQETLPLIFATYGNEVRYVCRDFPIASLHPQAEKAAEAAMCAFDQGKFWEYRDMLFGNQSALDVTHLKAYAEVLGLDVSAFNQCVDSGRYTAEVQQDFDDGRGYGVSGVPTFFINGQKLTGAQPFSTFQQAIDQALAKAGT